FRFSSSSLSNTMASHFGHLVHRPSGISRLRDLPEPSLGFLTKLVAELEAGGGVTAGSDVSSPNDFLLNEVVDIIMAIRVKGSQVQLRNGPAGWPRSADDGSEHAAPERSKSEFHPRLSSQTILHNIQSPRATVQTQTS